MVSIEKIQSAAVVGSLQNLTLQLSLGIALQLDWFEMK
jgi:hypothetical protein